MEEIKRGRGRPKIDTHITEEYYPSRRQAVNKPVLISGPGGIPGFQCGERRGLFLNLRLDVETNDVTYHLTSIFTEKTEMGEVIGIIELERNQRQTA